MADFELQRKNMVESQIRPSDITDRRIMRAMLALPRERFAPSDTNALAYMDQDLPVGAVSSDGRGRRALVAPRVLAHLVQLLEIAPGDRVLEVGTATGYGAAVLSHIAKSVVALECDAALAHRARSVAAELELAGLTVVTGPLSAGWAAEAPYAAIMLSGAVSDVPPALLDQLQDGGRMAAVVVDGGVGRLMQWRRLGLNFPSRHVAEVGARTLPGFERTPGFAF